MAQADTTSASIPMGVDVPRSCTLSNVSSSVVVPEDGSQATGNFTMSCNIDAYSFVVTTDSLDSGNLSLKNADGIKLPIQIIQTYMFNSVAYGNYELNSGSRDWWTGGILPIGAPIDAILKFKLRNPTTATTPAGVYTDTFRVSVTY
ncbi:hypothetical protein [Acinetobacter sp. ANC 3813]|uniref:hypothetical protein n=1 Tax=Acinetobacter sp. ANC 3813 TaxID=1977873 RepID=UPI00111C7743|nr:hypothetical protein [Acinetobacter sp. ANC 3813]